MKPVSEENEINSLLENAQFIYFLIIATVGVDLKSFKIELIRLDQNF